MSFEKINLNDSEFNPFSRIGKEWMLLTAGTEEKFNTMTASWGFAGVMWNKNVLVAVVRPSRYTYEFIENNETFTASFFGDGQRDALAFCGKNSGRDCDKVKETGLTPVFLDGAPAFDEAKTVLVCRKLYAQDMTPDSFIDKASLDSNGDQPLHKMFIAEIISAYTAL